MYEPLGWWYGQRCAANEYNGLTQMALDVLSTPGRSCVLCFLIHSFNCRTASSVDVERAFSFVGSIVSKRRHSLAPSTVQATASLGSYSKAGLVKPGLLVLPARGKAKDKLNAMKKV